MKRKIKWTRENCILEAKKYKNVADWQKGNRSSYVSAINLGILDECKLYLEKKYHKITKRQCVIEAKKYNTVSEWAKEDSKSYCPILALVFIHYH